MLPPVGSAPINRPRAATSLHASGNDHTPATYAAASSPIECPATTSGVTPNDSTRRYIATSNANSAGWAYSVRSSRASAGAPPAAAGAPNITSRSECPRCASNCAHTSSSAAAKAGNARYSPAPIPIRCAP